MMQIRKNIHARDPKLVADEFLLEKMLPKPLAELMVSIRHDPQFGMIMVLASGGIFVELLGDSQTLLLPITNTQILQALQRLKIAPLMQGFRGGDKADLDKIAESLSRLADYMIAEKDRIASLEINPLFIYKNQIYIIDVLMEVVI